MGIVIDIIAVAILAITIIFGYKKGLVGVAYKLLAFIVAAVLTFILYKPVSELIINNTKIDDNIYETIKTNISGKEDMEYTKIEYIDEYITTLRENNADIVSRQISINVTRAISAIVLFIAIRIVLIVFYKFSEMLAELPIIKQFNKAGGVIYGIIEGLIIVYIALYIAVLIGTISNNINLMNIINESIIGRLAMRIM